MRISELAERVAVPTSTVRFYERAGLLAEPARTPSGYRDYDEGAASRLLFVTRARRMGLSCEQITELLPIWDGTDCAAAHDAITDLVDAKRAEIAEHITELQRFADQLDEVRLLLDSSAPPPACRTDLSCCLPEADGAQPAPVALLHRDAARSN
jgi:DNA-binding transcriptional MerR regulator